MNISNTTSSSTDYSRITGLATGMDTDALVKQAVAGDQAKIDSVLQSKQTLEWQQEAYVDIIKDLKGLYNSYLDILGPNDTNMMRSSTYAGVTAISSDTAQLTATAAGGAVKGVYNVTLDIKALTAKDQSNVYVGKTQSSTLSSIGLTNGNVLNISVNGEAFSFTVDNTKTVGDLVTSLKSLTNGNGKTLGNLANINFSELTGKFTIETKDTGVAQKVTVSGTAAAEMGFAGVEKTGRDATIKIQAPGEAEVSITKTSNKFTVDNITYDLSGATEDQPITLTVKADATAQLDKFNKFVEKYNELIEKINTKIKEKKNYSYKPLTSAQKESMKDDEITKWEEQAKKGLLARESNLSNMLIQVRQTFYSSVQGAGISLSDIGITTTSNYRDGGKLQIDETKLKDSLENKGDLVQKLFTKSSTVADEKGILVRIKETLNSYIGSEGVLIKKAGYTNTLWAYNNQLSKDIESKKNTIKQMQSRLSDKQERYYKMFTALEKNMNNLNSQSNWLYSQLGTA